MGQRIIIKPRESAERHPLALHAPTPTPMPMPVPQYPTAPASYREMGIVQSAGGFTHADFYPPYAPPRRENTVNWNQAVATAAVVVLGLIAYSALNRYIALNAPLSKSSGKTTDMDLDRLLEELQLRKS